MGDIEFAEAEGEWGFLSNFYIAPITVDGKTYQTTEHYFQSQKFLGTEYEEEIRNAKTPGDSKTLGLQRKPGFRADWESVKIGLMKKCNLAKFTQHEDLKKKLLDTGDRKITERSDSDAYWGDGADRKGKNMLGIIIAEVRDEIRKSQK